MKGMGTLRKSAVIAAVCMAVSCVLGCNKPTPEQVAERTKLLYEAIRIDNLEQAKSCIKAGADVNKGGNSALRIAVECDRADMIKLLVKSKANVNGKDGKGYTALMHAAQQGTTDIARLLIKSGADVNARTDNGNTALMIAAARGRTNMAELLIKLGADVNAKTDSGYTVLMEVAWRYAYSSGIDGSYKTIAELLVKAGADVNAKDKYGKSALAYAEYSAIADLLRAAGAKE
ncbi:MAG: ankyrin repeat domain-containing protein [Treponemataceae bacterium]|nr:ankyrin repeat domain-containing protein [Treponemataceae bacterium]MDE7391463.1 ankyrin repeat domain-containing protein [Treponemataceae bacterium]